MPYKVSARLCSLKIRLHFSCYGYCVDQSILDATVEVFEEEIKVRDLIFSRIDNSQLKSSNDIINICEHHYKLFVTEYYQDKYCKLQLPNCKYYPNLFGTGIKAAEVLTKSNSRKFPIGKVLFYLFIIITETEYERTVVCGPVIYPILQPFPTL